MIPHGNGEQERCRQLMMAELDGELTASERKEFRILLDRYPQIQREYRSFKQLKEVTKSMALKKPDPEVWETYWYNVYNRIERGIAWFALTIGAVILIVYGLGEAMANLWRNPETPLILKIGIFAGLLGLILLLISVLREKLFLRRHERYKEVQR